MLDSERLYVELLFSTSKKYASWDPEVPVRCGDWGRITAGSPGWAFWRKRRGIFLKEGNIYQDGKAKIWGIPPPTEHGIDSDEGVTWITSKNAHETDASVNVEGWVIIILSSRIQTYSQSSSHATVLMDCKIQGTFKFSSGQGAILVMDNDTISTIDPPGSLRRLLDDPTMQGHVIVSEVHRCDSYARLLTLQSDSKVAIGLRVDSATGLAGANTDAKWVRSTTSGNFKFKVNKPGNRDFYPLFRLVSIEKTSVTTGMRGMDPWDSDESLELPPLPDAEPPWITREKGQGQQLR